MSDIYRGTTRYCLVPIFIYSQYVCKNSAMATLILQNKEIQDNRNQKASFKCVYIWYFNKCPFLTMFVDVAASQWRAETRLINVLKRQSPLMF